MRQLTIKLYTPSEAAEILPYCARTLVRFGKEGKIRRVKVGHKVTFTQDAIDEFIARHETPAATASKPTRSPKYSK